MAEFVLYSSGGFTFLSFLWILRLHIYIEVDITWLSDNNKLGKRVICFLFGLGIDNFLENINCFVCPCSLCPILSANPQIRPRAASCPRRSEAPGEKEKGLPL